MTKAVETHTLDLFGNPDETSSPSAPPPPPSSGDGGLRGDDGLPLGIYAERCYLAYAMSVVKGRALPYVEDGMKPVQRRILYSMREMGLTSSTKHVKSARVVGDVIGKLHPHGDQSVYDAMVRMAQGFTLRYPLIDGQGNFGSRDGDGAAAMRYTESRLTPVAELLLAEIDMGTVDFVPNYDGAFKEPALLPARLPMLLANGASGIAVGMATEIPSHNLRELGSAAIALLKKPAISLDGILAHVPGPPISATTATARRWPCSSTRITACHSRAYGATAQRPVPMASSSGARSAVHRAAISTPAMASIMASASTLMFPTSVRLTTST